MSATKVLLLGGHGKIALHLTPLLLAKRWDVTSVIRNADHEKEILALGKDQPGKLDVLLESLDDVKEVGDASRVLEKVKPQIVIWAAGMFSCFFLMYIPRNICLIFHAPVRVMLLHFLDHDQ